MDLLYNYEGNYVQYGSVCSIFGRFRKMLWNKIKKLNKQMWLGWQT